jgi:hypothetical protein
VLTVRVAWRRADFCAGRARIYGETQEARLVGNQRTHIHENSYRFDARDGPY